MLVLFYGKRAENTFILEHNQLCYFKLENGPFNYRILIGLYLSSFGSGQRTETTLVFSAEKKVSKDHQELTASLRHSGIFL